MLESVLSPDPQVAVVHKHPIQEIYCVFSIRGLAYSRLEVLSEVGALGAWQVEPHVLWNLFIPVALLLAWTPKHLCNLCELVQV